MPDADVGAIVAGLTKAQRDQWCEGNWNVMPRAHGYFEAGLVKKDVFYGVRLTPLGLAVRARILANADAGER